MSSGLAFVLLIATIPVLVFLVLAFTFVLADGIVSTMDKRPSETERMIKEMEVKIKNKFMKTKDRE